MRRIAIVIVLAFLAGILADRAVLAATPRPELRIIPPTETASPAQSIGHEVDPGARTMAQSLGPVLPPLLAAQEYALARLGAHQYGCLDALVARESGWRVTARNRSSGAYGLPQAHPASKMASAGADWRTNPLTQLRWMIGYIRARYGTACIALEHALTSGWY